MPSKIYLISFTDQSAHSLCFLILFGIDLRLNHNWSHRWGCTRPNIYKPNWRARGRDPRRVTAEFPGIGLQLMIWMDEAAHADEIEAMVAAFPRLAEAVRFTAAAVLPIGIGYRVEVRET
jgi:hypothetical protein